MKRDHADTNISDQKVVYKPTDELRKFLNDNIDKIQGAIPSKKKDKKIDRSESEHFYKLDHQ